MSGPVAHHLANILGKLGVSSRARLGAARAPRIPSGDHPCHPGSRNVGPACGASFPGWLSGTTIGAGSGKSWIGIGRLVSAIVPVGENPKTKFCIAPGAMFAGVFGVPISAFAAFVV